MHSSKKVCPANITNKPDYKLCEGSYHFLGSEIGKLFWNRIERINKSQGAEVGSDFCEDFRKIRPKRHTNEIMLPFLAQMLSGGPFYGGSRSLALISNKQMQSTQFILFRGKSQQQIAHKKKEAQKSDFPRPSCFWHCTAWMALEANNAEERR